MNLGDGQVHDLELYFADWDTTSRSEKVQLSDAVAGTVLDTESIAVVPTAASTWTGRSAAISPDHHHARRPASNAVLNGVFLDPVVTMSQMATAGVGMVPAGGRQPSLIEASFADLLGSRCNDQLWRVFDERLAGIGRRSRRGPIDSLATTAPASGSPASGHVATHSIDSLATDRAGNQC